MGKKTVKTIVIATKNRDKILEFQEKLGKKFHLKTLDDYPDFPEVIESGETIKENAYLKARALYAFTGLPSIADDTGLEVNALQGAPGVYSGRFAGENASYRDNVLLLLQRMKNIPQEQRGATFRTSIAYVDKQESWDVEGRVDGRILNEARGEGGFGYDPLFFYEPLQKTFSELGLKEKNRISHRGKALDALIHTLKIKKYL